MKRIISSMPYTYYKSHNYFYFSLNFIPIKLLLISIIVCTITTLRFYVLPDFFP